MEQPIQQPAGEQTDLSPKKRRWPLAVRILAGVLAVIFLLTGGLLALVRVSLPKEADINDETVAKAYEALLAGERYLNAPAAERVAMLLANLGREPRTAQECQQIAAPWIGRGAYGEAIVLYEKSLALDDGTDLAASADRYVRLASLHVLNGDRASAVPYYEKAAILDPTAYLPRLLLAQIHLENLAYDKAERELAAYMALQPQDTQSRRSLAMLEEGLGMYEEAKGQYRVLMAFDGRAEDYLSHGRLALLLGDGAACLSDMAVYLELAAEPVAEAFYLRGIAFAQQGEYAKAAADLYQALALGYENRAQCYVQLTNLQYLLGDMKQVIQAGQEAEKLLDAPDGALLQKIGLAALERGDYELSETYLTASLIQLPSLAENHYFRGVCRMMLEKYGDAVRDFDKAGAAGVMTQTCSYNSGVCSIQAGDYEAAKRSLQACVELGEDPEISASASELLMQLP